MWDIEPLRFSTGWNTVMQSLIFTSQFKNHLNPHFRECICSEKWGYSAEAKEIGLNSFLVKNGKKEIPKHIGIMVPQRCKCSLKFNNSQQQHSVALRYKKQPAVGVSYTISAVFELLSHESECFQWVNRALSEEINGPANQFFSFYFLCSALF